MKVEIKPTARLFIQNKKCQVNLVSFQNSGKTQAIKKAGLSSPAFEKEKF